MYIDTVRHTAIPIRAVRRFKLVDILLSEEDGLNPLKPEGGFPCSQDKKLCSTLASVRTWMRALSSMGAGSDIPLSDGIRSRWFLLRGNLWYDCESRLDLAGIRSMRSDLGSNLSVDVRAARRYVTST